MHIFNYTFNVCAGISFCFDDFPLFNIMMAFLILSLVDFSLFISSNSSGCIKATFRGVNMYSNSSVFFPCFHFNMTVSTY